MGRDHLLRIIIVRMDRSRFFIDLQHALQRLIRSIAEGHRSGSSAQGIIIITTIIINNKQHHPSVAVWSRDYWPCTAMGRPDRVKCPECFRGPRNCFCGSSGQLRLGHCAAIIIQRQWRLGQEWRELREQQEWEAMRSVQAMRAVQEHPGRKACRGPCQASRATGRPYPFRVCGRPCMLPKNHDPNTEPHYCGDEEQHDALDSALEPEVSAVSGAEIVSYGCWAKRYSSFCC